MLEYCLGLTHNGATDGSDSCDDLTDTTAGTDGAGPVSPRWATGRRRSSSLGAKNAPSGLRPSTVSADESSGSAVSAQAFAFDDDDLLQEMESEAAATCSSDSSGADLPKSVQKRLKKEREKAEKLARKEEKRKLKAQRKQEKQLEKARRSSRRSLLKGLEKATEKVEHSPENMATFARVSCDVLTCGVAELFTAFNNMKTRKYLYGTLFSFLSKNTVDATQTSYFTRIVYALLQWRTPQTLVFMKQHPRFVERVVHHIEAPGMVDLLLVIAKCGNTSGTLDWLADCHLVPRLLELLEPAYADRVCVTLRKPATASALGSSASASGELAATDKSAAASTSFTSPSGEVTVKTFPADVELKDVLAAFDILSGYAVDQVAESAVYTDGPLPVGPYVVIPGAAPVEQTGEKPTLPAAASRRARLSSLNLDLDFDMRKLERVQGNRARADAMDENALSMMHTNVARVLIGLVQLLESSPDDGDSMLATSLHDPSIGRLLLTNIFWGAYLGGESLSAFTYGLHVLTVLLNQLVANLDSIYVAAPADTGPAGGASHGRGEAGSARDKAKSKAKGKGKSRKAKGRKVHGSDGADDASTGLDSSSASGLDSSSPEACSSDAGGLVTTLRSATTSDDGDASSGSDAQFFPPGLEVLALVESSTLRSREELTPLLRAIHDMLDDFFILLLRTETLAALETTTGLLDPPLGSTRLKVVRFFCRLLHTRAPLIEFEIMRRGILNECVELFFHYEWNNFLHLTVSEMVLCVLQSPSEPIVQALLTFTKLHTRLLDAVDGNAADQAQPLGCRRGYMGHVTLIALHLSHALPLADMLRECDRWMAYVDGELQSTSDVNTNSIFGVEYESLKSKRQLILEGKLSPAQAAAQVEAERNLREESDRQTAAAAAVAAAPADTSGKDAAPAAKAGAGEAAGDDTGTPTAADAAATFSTLIPPPEDAPPPPVPTPTDPAAAGSESAPGADRAGAADGENAASSSTAAATAAAGAVVAAGAAAAGKDGDDDAGASSSGSTSEAADLSAGGGAGESSGRTGEADGGVDGGEVAADDAAAETSAILDSESDASVMLVNKKNDIYGDTALHVAAATRKVGVVDLLVARGMDVNATNNSGYTPLNRACCISQVLLKDMDSRNELQQVVRLLLEHGADPERPNRKQQTPLDRAAHYGHKDVVQTLLEAQPATAVNTKDMMGISPLYRALNNERTDIAGLLFSAMGGIGSPLPSGLVALLDDPDHRSMLAVDVRPLLAVGAYVELNNKGITLASLRERGLLTRAADVSALIYGPDGAGGGLSAIEIKRVLAAVDAALAPEELAKVPAEAVEAARGEMMALRDVVALAATQCAAADMVVAMSQVADVGELHVSLPPAVASTFQAPDIGLKAEAVAQTDALRLAVLAHFAAAHHGIAAIPPGFIERAQEASSKSASSKFKRPRGVTHPPVRALDSSSDSDGESGSGSGGVRTGNGRRASTLDSSDSELSDSTDSESSSDSSA
ncbi:SAPS domain-containing protein [Thecamonas trahens ATCC 50062]|uniref:SAPS domain-containing protein n=1 Tax=Thecamonas trahens ATCC 50062 TaxID=461836 RepID=A0A0L0D6G7_THETB|nr:SAPS domain-containing protein [Thecamonas trahens ATCC 50062]KNC47795.1 SAPS domain-containing protein [Thecamonas trahens ATCC 50062]|eukprot:XP_013759273.1 SAPS domain-containing protein [Thecamonas trahens ATCC 50062]